MRELAVTLRPTNKLSCADKRRTEQAAVAEHLNGRMLDVGRRSGEVAAAAAADERPSADQRISSSEATRKGEARDAESGGNNKTRLCGGETSSPAVALGRAALSASAWPSAAAGRSHWRRRVEGRSATSRRKNARNTPTSTTTEATSAIAMRLLEVTAKRQQGTVQLPVDPIRPLRRGRPFDAARRPAELRPRRRPCR